MFDLKSAITVVELIVAVVATLVLGDYLGHKVGRWRLATVTGSFALVSIVAFAIYAAVILA